MHINITMVKENNDFKYIISLTVFVLILLGVFIGVLAYNGYFSDTAMKQEPNVCLSTEKNCNKPLIPKSGKCKLQKDDVSGDLRILNNDNSLSWSAKSHDVGISPYDLMFDVSGNLVLRDSTTTNYMKDQLPGVVWSSNNPQKGIGPYKVTLSDSENDVSCKLIITDNTSKVLWTSDMQSLFPMDYFHYTCNSSNQPCPNKIYSPTKNCSVEMRVNGELALSNEKGAIVWSSGTAGKGKSPYVLRLNLDGNLIIYDNVVDGKLGSILWSSNTSNIGKGPYTLSVQPDYKLVIKDSMLAIVWSSPSQVTTPKSETISETIPETIPVMISETVPETIPVMISETISETTPVTKPITAAT
jgi:hypothetical protein